MRKVFIIGYDGRVGSALIEGLEKAGYTFEPVAVGAPLPCDPDAVLIDAGPAGRSGYQPETWSNYFGAVERAVSVIAHAEANGFAAVVLFSTPWVQVRTRDPYADSKALIEDIAKAHNRHGNTFVIVDRVGMQNPQVPVGSATPFEESVRQQDGEIAARVISAINLVTQEPSMTKPLPPVLYPKPFVDDAR